MFRRLLVLFFFVLPLSAIALTDAERKELEQHEIIRVSI